MNDLELIEEIRMRWIKEKEHEKKQIEIETLVKPKELGVEVQSKCDFHGDCDHPDTMENGTAFVLYIIAMVVGAIFVDRWLIWIMATVIFIGFITRHQRRKNHKTKI